MNNKSNIFSSCTFAQIIRISIFTTVFIVFSIAPQVHLGKHLGKIQSLAIAQPLIESSPKTILSRAVIVGQTKSHFRTRPDDPQEQPYTYRDRPSSDGIGKVYMGREIAQVMGHRGAAWLERPSRIQEEKPHVLVADLDIAPTDVIADIGAGTGYLTARIAPTVPKGKVLAVDVQPEMLGILESRITNAQLNNVELILADEDNPHLPQGEVDMAIMLDVYHELEYPLEMMQSVVESLRPGGQVVLVEYRGENPLIPIKRLHKMTERQTRRELQAVGLTWVSTNEDLPRQHLMVFEKSI